MTEPVHDLSGHFPLINLGEGLELPTYYIVISATVCICIFWLVRRAEARGLNRNTALDLAMIVLVAGFLGSRIFHVLFEEPSYYLESPLRVFEFWRGGFVWFGGAILGAGSGIYYAYRKKLPFGTWLDFSAPVVSLGYALGRVACLFTGCCYGAVCVLNSGYQFRHPTQVYAIVWELGVVSALLWLERKRATDRKAKWLKPSGRIFTIWIFLHSIGRIIMEWFRADPRGPEPLGLSIATWISLILIVIVVGWEIRRSRKM